MGWSFQTKELLRTLKLFDNSVAKGTSDRIDFYRGKNSAVEGNNNTAVLQYINPISSLRIPLNSVGELSNDNFSVNQALFLRWLAQCENESINFSFPKKKNSEEIEGVVVESGRNKITLPMHYATPLDFPGLTDGEKKFSLRYNGDEKAISDTIRFGSFAITNNLDIKGDGIRFEFIRRDNGSTGTFRVVSTDMTRLAVSNYTMSSLEGEETNDDGTIAFGVSKQMKNVLLELIKGGSDISFYEDKNTVGFVLDEDYTTLVHSKEDGNYPDYEAFLPKSFEASLRINCNDLLKSARSVFPFTSDDFKSSHVYFEDGNVRIEATSVRGESVSNIDYRMSKGFEDNLCFHMRCNLQHFIDPARNYETEELVIRLNDPDTPFVLSPASDDMDSDDAVDYDNGTYAMCMPMVA